MKADVKYCEECVVCQRNKALALSPTGLLMPLEIPNAVWTDISMGFIDGLSKATGFNVIFLVVDRLRKYVHFLALKPPYTAKSVAEIFVKEIVGLHGNPRSIVSDQDKWKHIFVALVKKDRKSGCPAALAKYWYNTTYQVSIGITLFQAVYGCVTPPLIYYGDSEMPNSTLNQRVKERDVALGVLKEHLLIAQEKMKKRNEKLSPKYFGTCRVLERICSVAYKLELPPSVSIRPVFHVSQLKGVLGKHSKIHQLDHFITENHEWVAKPEEVYGYRKNPMTGVWEVLISWKRLQPHEAIWRFVMIFHNNFQIFTLRTKSFWRRVMLGHLSYDNIVGGGTRGVHV
ncbi:peroxidase 64 [Cucumis melo var. makuwa]|uniref:Peroxidase 64 n=1 Tax=Cucumis melo var. makuwa TaxID=1194695 RepID=A0A5D3DAS7_CUCMM|nr:peroxidase 64 [Cucumis melo var. makuwa]TYK20634.1 peroxidase 64 [Cucumis melo var. makuwa]